MQNSPSPAKTSSISGKPVSEGRIPIPEPGSSIVTAAKAKHAQPRAAGRSRRKPKARPKKTAVQPSAGPPFDPLEKRHKVHPAAFIPSRGIEKNPWSKTKNGPPGKAPDSHATDEFENAYPGYEDTEADFVRPAKPLGFGWSRHLKIPAACVLLAALLFMAVLFWNSRTAPGMPEPLRASDAEIQAFNEAMQLSIEGNASAALEKLRAVEKRNPEAPSLDYVFALLFLQSGDPRAATHHAESSIRKGERVSDSFILKSLAESSLSSGLRDSAVVREALLRQAISADPANPFAMAELAGVLREQGREDEALKLLQAAQARLHPVDSHVVVETFIRLLELDRLPDERLPEAATEGPLPEMFASAYILFRQGKSREALEILDACRKQSPPFLFDYITSDNLFAKLLTESKENAL